MVGTIPTIHPSIRKLSHSAEAAGKEDAMAMAVDTDNIMYKWRNNVTKVWYGNGTIPCMAWRPTFIVVQNQQRLLVYGTIP